MRLRRTEIRTVAVIIALFILIEIGRVKFLLYICTIFEIKFERLVKIK